MTSRVCLCYIVSNDWLIFSPYHMGEGNGNPLQYSCVENPVDRGAWWAAVHRVVQSQTRLKWLSMHACIGKGNGNPLQCSCLENPRYGGAWWAAVYGVAQSRTRLKWYSSSSSSPDTRSRVAWGQVQWVSALSLGLGDASGPWAFK